jgi:hypothetical protein
MTRLFLAVAAVAALLASTGAPAARSTSRPCTASETRGVVVEFVRAWTAGDLKAIRRLVAPEPHFLNVTVAPPGARAGHYGTDRRSLPAYIARRHGKHDRLSIATFRFHGSDLRGTERYGHFEFTATRDADDWASNFSHERRGKGAIVCNLSRPALALFVLG